MKVFKKSSFSYPSRYPDCVYVRMHDMGVSVRRNQEKPMLKFTKSEWVAFIKGVKNGEFDIE